MELIYYEVVLRTTSVRVCILYLVIRHENRIPLRCIILSSVASQVPYFSTLPHKWWAG
jgi:hypothetical protein